MGVPEKFFDKFGRVWSGGFFEGNPLDPMGGSHYSVFGYNSILYTTFLLCIRPYVNEDTTALEIGPGRGAWTKALLQCGARKVYAVDAAPAEHTRFWDYIGKTDRAEYITSSDLTLSAIPNGSIDYFFSFGVFCHLRPEMCESYIEALVPKLRPGANGFLMIADFDKFNSCIESADRLSLNRFFLEQKRKAWMPARWGYFMSWRYLRGKDNLGRISKDDNRALAGNDGNGAAWFHWGVDRACAFIEERGLAVILRDVGTVARDPIIHFKKRPVEER